MFKKLMSKNLNILTYISSGLSLFSLILAADVKQFKNKNLKLQETNELLEKQVNVLKIDELKNEITKNKVEYFRTSLEEVQNKLLTEVETIQNLENKTIEQKEVLNTHLNNLSNESENMQQMIGEILKYFSDDNNKFLGDNLLELFKNLINCHGVKVRGPREPERKSKLTTKEEKGEN